MNLERFPEGSRADMIPKNRCLLDANAVFRENAWIRVR